jgi:hypothetical protein
VKYLIRPFTLFVCAVFSYLPSQAALPPTTAILPKNALFVKNVQPIPSSVRACMPNGGVSLVYGICKLAPHGQNISLHLYSVPTGRTFGSSSHPWSEETDYLDLFEQIDNKKKGKLRRLNSIKIIRQTGIRPKEIFLMWLEPKQQRGPIVVLHSYSHAWNKWMLLAFPKSLRDKPKVQSFEEDTNPSFAFGLSFAEVDKRGFMIVRRDFQENTGGAGTSPRDHSNYLYWNGNGFFEQNQINEAESTEKMPAVQRIRFARGAVSKTVRGTLDKKHSSAHYVVRAKAGQRMSLKVWPLTKREGVIPLVLVTTPDGKSSGEKSMRFDTLATQAGDYHIRVKTNLMASNGASGNFGLKVWIK